MVILFFTSRHLKDSAVFRAISALMPHEKVSQHFQTLEMRRKRRGVNDGDTVLEESNNTFLQGMLFLLSPVRDNVWKGAQKAVISSPTLDYFWRATCCISHCTSQKSCQGFLHIYSAWFTGTINYSCRLCLYQFTRASWAHHWCVLQSRPLSQRCFWSTVRSHRKMLTSIGLLLPASIVRPLA